MVIHFHPDSWQCCLFNIIEFLNKPGNVTFGFDREYICGKNVVRNVFQLLNCHYSVYDSEQAPKILT